MNLNFLLDSGLLGLEYAMLALGVYITFRILNIPDLTVDGSFTFGLAVSAVFAAGGHPFLGLLMALLAGAVAGCVTGLLQTRWGIHPILAGILTMSGLYTINITVMGSPNISLINSNKFFTFLEDALTKDGARYLTVGVIVLLCVGLLALFFKTSLGLCIRATGNNEAMVRASSINPNFTKMVALALSNGLVALSGGVAGPVPGVCGHQLRLRHDRHRPGFGYHRGSVLWPAEHSALLNQRRGGFGGVPDHHRPGFAAGFVRRQCLKAHQRRDCGGYLGGACLQDPLPKLENSKGGRETCLKSPISIRPF